MDVKRKILININPGICFPRIIPFILLSLFIICSFRSLPESKAGLQQKSDSIFSKVDKMPLFNGNDAAEFALWASREIKYPVEAIKQKIVGNVTVNFIVEKDGSVSDVKVLRSVPTLDEEALRVVQSSPKWTPGMNNNVPVRVTFTMPINFKTTFPSDEKLKVKKQ
ncbi:MAG: energy transducer TonB [Odoribacter sp.]|nr:energy transducer TonB [Odoribacter sp.]